MIANHHCSIAPPDLLARLALDGTSAQKEAALRALATSAAFRQQRAVMGKMTRQFHLPTGQALGFNISSTRRLTVYDNQTKGRTFLPGVRMRGWGEPPSSDVAVNEAYDGSSETYDFYKKVMGRNSLDNANMELVSSVHYGVAYDNAFWDGTQMVYGDGSGQIFQIGGLTHALDVIGHELTHGITEFTAGLAYSKQSGALNESFSDVFGSLVKQYTLKQSAQDADWLIGEGVLVPSLGKALRSLKAPGTAYSGDHQPATMADYVELPDDNDPRNDNGGVHINSGIPNHAFYLAATALGGNAWEKAGKIWYRTLTTQLHANSQFDDAATATVDMASTLFGSAEAHAVESAWKSVGVLS
ncbi:M4 family metallopeptidase [Arthrobacter cryoconiti]|uniref:Neutral metalloproteinase n=1 Tax=Arthrobacter cryoconiti TaxID=748907 RepID=A0ABV8R2R7_9MICC|nr:M4 family metallopeptidase [Arthrobacter cryoconiti]MCC9067180.1 M4 family metallopeptidase [Arthrobacter cryoconiti]